MEKVSLRKYEAIGIIEDALEHRGPSCWLRGRNPRLNMAIAIADVLFQLKYLTEDIYKEVFDYFKNKYDND